MVFELFRGSKSGFGDDAADDGFAASAVIDDRDGVEGVGFRKGPGNHLGDIFLFDEVESRRDFHALVHGADLGDKGLGFFFGGAVILHTGQLRQVRQLFPDGFAVVLQHDREDDCVCQSVRGVIEAAQGMGDGVDVSDAGTGEGIAAFIGGDQHLGPGLHVIAVAVGPLQVAEDLADRLFRHADGFVRVVLQVGIGFDRMRQGIHPRGGGDLRRQLPRQFRVQHGVFRDKAKVHNGILVVRVAVGNDCGDGRLRSGACRCGHCDKGRDLFHHLQEPGQLADFRLRADDARGSTLCRVHRRSAADGDKAVAGAVQIELLDFVYCFDGGV